MTVDPIYRPATVADTIRTWLQDTIQGIGAAAVTVHGELTGTETTPLVVLQARPEPGQSAPMGGHDHVQLHLTATSVHRSKAEAAALGDLVRASIAGRAAGGAWLVAMDLDGIAVVDRGGHGDGVGDVVQGVPQWSETFTVVYARG